MLLALAFGPIEPAQSEAAQSPPASSASSGQPPSADVVTRDAGGKVTIRAVRIAEPLQIDGRLDESIYQTTPAINGFIQQLPDEGKPTTEQTDVWVLFDDKNVYISARCFDDHPEREVITEMRRDGSGISQNDNFTVVLDTFHDLRNGFWFQTNPLGAMRDLAIVDEGQNLDWNTIVDVRSVRTDDGWTTEFAIPFKSLRYPGGGPQTWGINFRRNVRWRGELSTLSPLPAAYGQSGFSRLSTAATLIGLETPAVSKNLELKPFALTGVATDRAATVPLHNDFRRDAGIDLKYGLTNSLTADVTVNTDFAQVEEDLQQVNLTRFSLFFPEKRDFFLEGAGLFAFGSPPTNQAPPTTPEIPVLFFSRQIGLSQSQVVPVIAGGRVTGKAGPFSIGALDVQTGDKPEAGAASTNFSVLRLKRDVLRRSNIGMIVTRRSPDTGGASETNLAAGLDANLLLYKYVTVNGYYAKTSTASLHGDDASYRGRFDYGADRYGFAVEHLLIGTHFNPEVGFIRRNDLRRNYGLVRFSPRPNGDVIRKLTWQASFDHITSADRTVVQNREGRANFGIEFQNSDTWNTDYIKEYEFLPKDFTIARGVVVPKGGYAFQSLVTSYLLGQQRRVSGTVTLSHGSLYGGTKTEATYSGHATITTRIGLEPSVTLNWVDLPTGSFSSTLIANRFVVTPTPRLLFSSLVQFNAANHSLSSSIRMRWEYAPRSEVFVVYSDGRAQTTNSGPYALLNHSLAVKVTRLFRR